MDQLIIGSHVSYGSKDGLMGSLEEALSYGANTFMFYTGAPQNTTRGPIDEKTTQKAKAKMLELGLDIKEVIIHAPYIVNLANDQDHEKYSFAINFLKQELQRAAKLGIEKVVLHPGSHVGLGTKTGISNIIKGLNEILDTPDGPIICLETMAGKGTEIGRTFEELAAIIKGIKEQKRIMVCLDTCHINDAGYDLKNFDHVLAEFDHIIGLDKLACVHVNDSKNACGAHKDRHANIGFGTIGFDNLLKVIYHEKLKEVPKILETPYVSVTEESKDRTYPPYKQEIAMIKAQKFNANLIEQIRNYHK